MLELLRKFLIKRHDKSGFQYNQIGDVEKDSFSINRFYPMFMDDEFEEYPWWTFFNVLLHRWVKSDLERMHDHPRWSITIVLKGELIEHTPWRSSPLKAGSIVIRSRKAIHRFELVSDDAWTIFIVGKRRHKQNWYNVTPF